MDRRGGRGGIKFVERRKSNFNRLCYNKKGQEKHLQQRRRENPEWGSFGREEGRKDGRMEGKKEARGKGEWAGMTEL